MLRVKLILIFAAVVFAASSCFDREPERYSIAASNEYEASLFRQNCGICHGPEGEGKALDDGTVVPSLRTGELKKVTEKDIYDQISEGGNGMTPFRTQLTDREIRLLTDLVHNKLRK